MADGIKIPMKSARNYQAEVKELLEVVDFMEGPSRKLEAAAQAGQMADALAHGRILRQQLLQIQEIVQDIHQALDRDIRQVEEELNNHGR